MRDRLTRVVEAAEQHEKRFRTAVAGENLKRSDDTTYFYSDPADATDRLLLDLVAAQAAASTAKAILSMEGKDSSSGETLTLTDAVRRYVDSYVTNLKWERGGWSSNPISNVIAEAKASAVSKLVGELIDMLKWEDTKEANWQEKLAAKTAELIEDKPMGISERAVALVLTEPKMRAALDHAALEQALAVFKLTPEFVVACVQVEDKAAKDAADAKRAQEQAKLDAKRAKQCVEQIWPQGGYTKSRCSKAGKYLVTFDDASQVLICGTHKNSKYSAWTVGRNQFIGGKTKEIVGIEEAS